MAAKKKASRKKSPVTQLLEKQHRVVKGIFKKLEDGSPSSAALLKELADNLAAHMAIEQEIYYPAVKDIKEDLVLESYEEHSLAELGLKRLLATRSSDGSFEAKVTACKELIEHHVEEEEEELFPAVDRKLKAEHLTELAAQMKTRFEQVLASGHKKTLPKGMEQTSADVEHI